MKLATFEFATAMVAPVVGKAEITHTQDCASHLYPF
jgi:hypothetical protein